MASIFSRLCQSLLPQTCLCCRGPALAQLAFCQPCLNELPRLTQACPICALPLLHQPSTPDWCGECLRLPPAFVRVRAGFIYADPINRLIPHFKHQGHWPSGYSLALAFARQLTDELSPQDYPDALVPVPLHWRRVWQRGFNQSALIASILGKTLNIPLRQPLRRQLHATAQHQLNRQQRLHNLRRAFSLRQSVAGMRLALVDDVMTTGATVRQLSQLLMENGAEQVEVWVVARTPKQT